MKYIFAFEISFAFTPIVLLWFLGLYGVAGFVEDAIRGEAVYSHVLLAMLFGLFGIVGIIMASFVIIKNWRDWKFSIFSVLFVTLGIVGLFLGSSSNISFDPVSLLFFWAPLAAGVHLLFLVLKQLTRTLAGVGA